MTARAHELTEERIVELNVGWSGAEALNSLAVRQPAISGPCDEGAIDIEHGCSKPDLMTDGHRHPALANLHVFLAAAEHGSFTKAAELLNLPQSSVTRQIAMLEQDLGCPLFQRHRRGVLLTDEGASYLDEVKPALERISVASHRIRRRDTDWDLRIRVYPSFATCWLIRRLQAFNDWAPDINVSLDAVTATVDFDRHDVDLAIQFGKGRWAGATAELLFRDEIEPVCTPELLHKVGPLASLEDLSKVLLLQSRYRRDDWKAWLEANTELWPQIRTMEFTSSVLTYQACLDGLGVAMGQKLLLDSEIAERRLVRPMDRPLKRPGMGYYLIAPATREMALPARKFASWIRTLAQP
jgi:LysR family glycine cleavage system transcriptional activator